MQWSPLKASTTNSPGFIDVIIDGSGACYLKSHYRFNKDFQSRVEDIGCSRLWCRVRSWHRFNGMSEVLKGLDEEADAVVKNVCRTGTGTALDASGIHFTLPVRSKNTWFNSCLPPHRRNYRRINFIIEHLSLKTTRVAPTSWSSARVFSMPSSPADDSLSALRY